MQWGAAEVLERDVYFFSNISIRMLSFAVISGSMCTISWGGRARRQNVQTTL